ncbi:MAG: hypothetical protein IT285_10435 [Bdellovibrionales bacterium]|nr:hypothetical protein [Bdellovibrionales bacterium]
MKRLLVALCAVGMLTGSQAMASDARVHVMGNGLGGDAGGSLYYNDNYNMFYNPAYVNDYTNWVTIEKAGAASSAGFVTGMGSLNVGAFMNRGMNQFETKPVDIIIGGDMGMKWGTKLHYAKINNKNNLDLAAGVVMGDLAPFAHFRIMGDVGGDKKLKDMGLGLKYTTGEWTPFATFNNTKAGDTVLVNNVSAGIGRNTKLSEGVMLNYAVAYAHDLEGESGRFPITLSAEGAATSWLKLRGGFTFQKVTTARLGATFTFSGVDMDWAVGSAAGGTDGTMFGMGDSVITTAGLTYKW